MVEVASRERGGLSFGRRGATGRRLRLGLAAMAACLAACPVAAKDAASPYGRMAPAAQYAEAGPAAEIALARSAAPAALSDGAEIMVLGPQGFETAVKGGNGFVCLVERSWVSRFDDEEFWNPKIRSPTCYNRAGARTVLAAHLEQTKWALAGLSKPQIRERAMASLRSSRYAPAAGAMCYMMSKQGFLADAIGHAAPHLMFFMPRTGEQAWGANLTGSPVRAEQDEVGPVTIFFVSVSRWSDGTPAAH